MKYNKSICFVAPYAYPVLANKDFMSCGGAEIQQILLAKALLKEGYHITFVVDDFGQNAREVHSGIKVIRGPFRYLGGSNWFFPIDTIKLIRILKDINADIYILKTPRSLLFAMALHRKLFGAKLIKLIAHDRDCRKSSSGLASHLYPLGTKYLDYTVFQTEYQQQVALKALKLRGGVIRNIAHCLNGQHCNLSRNIDVLWVGSCIERKQANLMLDLAEEMPDTNITMIIAPGRNPELNRSIECRAKSISNIDYKGFVEYAHIGQYYARAKIVAFTSRAEGFPNVFLQAWQASIPVVSLLIDPDKVITKNKLGFVSGDLQRMKNDIQTLLANDELRRDLGRNAKNYVDRHHHPAIIVKQFIHMLKALP